MRLTCTAAGTVIVAVILMLAGIFGGAHAQSPDTPKDALKGALKDDAPKLGQKIANVTFATADGKKASLYDLKDKEAVVAVFLSFDCPNSTGYAPILADMAKKYAERKVAFVGICCGEDDTPASVAKHAEEFKLGFPVYKDDQGAAVEALKAGHTPEAFLLDHNF